MLYSDFLRGTHAPDNIVSYIIYSGLNHIHMWHEDYTRMEAFRDGRKILEALDNVGAMKQITEIDMKDFRQFAKLKLSSLYGKCCFDDINRQEPDKERK